MIRKLTVTVIFTAQLISVILIPGAELQLTYSAVYDKIRVQENPAAGC